MFKVSPFFPRRLFLWSLFRQCTSLIVTFTIVGALSWLFLDKVPWSPFTFFLIALGLGLFVSLLVQLILLRRLLTPLGRLIEKTRGLRQFPFDLENDIQDFGEDDPGEWFELDRALNQLGQSLRVKTIELSREKTQARAIMASISEAVLAISKDHEVLFFNPQLSLLLNLKDGVVDQRIFSILRQPDILEAYERSLEKGEPRRIEISLSEMENHRDFILSVAPLKKRHNDEVYGAVGIFYDVTELKATDRVRIEFVGNVSHELRTPLTSISGYLQTVIQDFEQGRLEEAKGFLSIIQNNVNRLKSLVADLLDLSNLESGKEIRVDWISTEELTESVMKQVQSKGHKIDFSFESQSVYADFDRAAQVLRNLLENAIRYVPLDKNISVHWVSGENGTLLKVKDNGPGIEEQHQSRLFERFYRIDKSRARIDGGTGIGLSIVKHIMQRHKGSVELKSEVGKGSEFICLFPSPAQEIS